MKTERIPLIPKVIAFHVIFMVMHYLYEWFPGTLTRLFGATSESMFQHMKAVFFSYLLLTAIEFAIVHRNIHSRARYVYARPLQVVIVLLFLIALSEFVIFNDRLPWFDVFAIPPGWE